MRKNIYVVVLVCALLFAPFNADAFDEQRKFAGHEYDRDTGLSYMQSRYYNGGIGRFISQDPAFLAVGDDEELKQITNIEREKYLSDPQLANSYSYVANNPLKYTNPQGEFIDTLADLAFIGYDLYKLGQAWYQGESLKGELANLGLDAGGALIPGVTGLGMVNRVAQGAGKVGEAAKLIGKSDDITKGAKDIFSRAAEHSYDHKDRAHYLGKSVQEIKNIAINTYNNFDIKVNIKDVKKYFYNSKTNDLFINNSRQPTIFQPKDKVGYLRDAVSLDIKKGGAVK